jgi:hypothetical protein
MKYMVRKMRLNPSKGEQRTERMKLWKGDEEIIRTPVITVIQCLLDRSMFMIKSTSSPNSSNSGANFTPCKNTDWWHYLISLSPVFKQCR